MPFIEGEPSAGQGTRKRRREYAADDGDDDRDLPEAKKRDDRCTHSSMGMRERSKGPRSLKRPGPTEKGLRTLMSRAGFLRHGDSYRPQGRVGFRGPPTSMPYFRSSARRDDRGTRSSVHDSRLTVRDVAAIRAADEAATPANINTARRRGLQLGGPRPRSEFYPGQIICAAHHATALDKRADPLFDKNFVQSQAGLISSKRRMMVVLWVHQSTLIVLPMSTHSRRPLAQVFRNRDERHEYVCIWDVRNFCRPEHGSVVLMNAEKCKGEPLHELSTVRLTEAYTINMQEYIEPIGYLNAVNTQRLQALWQERTLEAKGGDTAKFKGVPSMAYTPNSAPIHAPNTALMSPRSWSSGR